MHPPFGWVVDGTRRQGALAWLYQRGLTFDEALKSHDFMYVNFWSKKESAYDLKFLFAYQESYMPEGENPLVRLNSPKARDELTRAPRLSGSRGLRSIQAWQNTQGL